MNKITSPAIGCLKLLKVEKRIKGITAYTRIQLFQGYSFEVAGYSAVTPNDFLYPSNSKIQSTPDNSNLQGKSKSKTSSSYRELEENSRK